MSKSLARRLVRISARLATPTRAAPPFSPEDIAAMQRIITRMYSDPVRYAKRIAVLDRCRRDASQAGAPLT